MERINSRLAANKARQLGQAACDREIAFALHGVALQ